MNHDMVAESSPIGRKRTASANLPPAAITPSQRAKQQGWSVKRSLTKSTNASRVVEQDGPETPHQRDTDQHNRDTTIPPPYSLRPPIAQWNEGPHLGQPALGQPAFGQARQPSLSLPQGAIQVFGGENVSAWILDVEEIVFGACGYEEKTWLQLLPAFLKGEARTVYRTSLRDRGWTDIKRQLETTFNSPTHQARLQNNLSEAKQASGETITAFIERVKSMAQMVDPVMSQRELRLYIANGIRDNDIKVQFLRGSANDLHAVTQDLAILESAKEQSTLKRTAHQVNAIDEEGRTTAHKWCQTCRRMGSHTSYQHRCSLCGKNHASRDCDRDREQTQNHA